MSFSDNVYSNINDIQTASMDYLSKYTALARCIQANPNTQTTSCSVQQTAFDIAESTSGSNKKIQDNINALDNVNISNITNTTYANNRANIISSNAANSKRIAGLTALMDGTFYLESKRETDAVIYAWTLWLVIFIITAICVFSYM